MNKANWKEANGLQSKIAIGNELIEKMKGQSSHVAHIAIGDLFIIYPEIVGHIKLIIIGLEKEFKEL